MIQERKLIVPEEYSGERLDKIVSKLVPEISRSQLKKSLKIIQVNGKKTKLSRCVARGDEVFLSWEEQTVSALVPEDIPLEIVYEDENVVVINKPSGLVTHPAAGNWTGTLANGLLFHLNRQQDGKENLQAGSSQAEEPGFRTGIVHRLDKETSGLIITAKNFESEKYLQEQFFHRRVQKEYIAILKQRAEERKREMDIIYEKYRFLHVFSFVEIELRNERRRTDSLLEESAVLSSACRHFSKSGVLP